MGEAGWELIAPVLAREGVVVTPEQRALLARYVALLLHWGRRINLTSARDERTVWTRHVLDALMLERPSMQACLPPSGATGLPPGASESPLRWVDVGAGGGLPSLVVAVMHPRIQVTAVETVAKKVTFLQQAGRELGLGNFHPLRIDANELAASETGAGKFDVVSARAFAELEVFLELAGRLARAGGTVWAMKGKRLAEEQERLSPRALAAFAAEPAVFPYAFAEWEMEGVVAVYTRRANPAGTTHRG